MLIMFWCHPTQINVFVKKIYICTLQHKIDVKTDTIFTDMFFELVNIYKFVLVFFSSYSVGNDYYKNRALGSFGRLSKCLKDLIYSIRKSK